ncbi:hypothetical protein C8Q79DRAFT_499062 [Trametes meyenii]|nr:hypothetical protein C8Q79DRAFT_499062 [Trametes meyenii]
MLFCRSAQRWIQSLDVRVCTWPRCLIDSPAVVQYGRHGGRKGGPQRTLVRFRTPSISATSARGGLASRGSVSPRCRAEMAASVAGPCLHIAQ